MMPVVSILVHVADWRTATGGYARVFAQAVRIYHPPDDVGHLDIGGLALGIVNADGKVASGAVGSVVHWQVMDLHGELQRLTGIGATLYRGPMSVEDGWLCQVRDPWAIALA